MASPPSNIPPRERETLSAKPQYPLNKSSTFKRTNLAELAHDELQQRIADGQLPVGERIIIDQIAKELGTSLIPIREALARLHAERMVSYEPNKGFRVAPTPDVNEIEKLIEARIIIEQGSLEQGMHQVNEAFISELKSLNSRIEHKRYGNNFRDYSTFVHLNEVFHKMLVGLAQNRFINEAYDNLGYHQRIAHILHGRGVPDLECIVNEHNEVISCLERKSIEDAKSALRRHILDGFKRLHNP